MFPLRHAAARLLTSRSVASIARPRTITSLTSKSTQHARFTAPFVFPRRWASSEAEAKSQSETIPEDEVPAQVIPTESQAAASSEAAPITEVDEQASVDNAINASSSISELTSDVGAGSQGYRPRSSGQREPATPKETIYVGNLFFDVTENDLEKEFSRFGTIKTLRLIKDVRGISKGFSYIEFENTEQAQAAITDLHQQLYEGRRLVVSYANSNPNAIRRDTPRTYTPQNSPSKTLFIGNMSFEMTDRDLNNLFRGIRNVIDVRVAIDRRTGKPRGFAHADFVDVKSAMEATKVLSEKECYGRRLRIDYSYGPSTAPRNTPRNEAGGE